VPTLRGAGKNIARLHILVQHRAMVTSLSASCLASGILPFWMIRPGAPAPGAGRT